MKKRFKNDQFQRVRGGSSKLLEISCAKCGQSICKYQKDGPGHLKRMYVDRIVDPGNFKVMGKVFCCATCGEILGHFKLYEKENRPAYSVLLGKVIKMKSEG